MQITRKFNELLFEKKKILLLILFICYPIINFLIINTNQIKFISNTFYLFILSLISFFFISFLIISLLTSKNFSFGLFFLIAFFFNIEIYYYDITKYFFENWNTNFLFIYLLNISNLISLQFIAIPAIILLIFILFYFIYELVKKKFIQLFIFFFIIINITHSAIIHKPHKIFKQKAINKSIDELDLVTNKKKLTITDKPNVFYFVLGSLGSISTLEKNGIDTKSIHDYLLSKDYKVSLNSKSSYTETSLSLSSIYNLDYIVDGISTFYTKSEKKGLAHNYDYYPFFSKYQKIPLVNELEKINYKFFKIENSYARCNNNIKITCLRTDGVRSLSKFYDDYGLEVFFKRSFIYQNIRDKFKIDNLDGYDAIGHYKNIFFNSENVLDAGSNFVLIHHMSPHRPMRSEDCKILEHPERNLFTNKNHNSSVRCVFNRIKEINEIILKTYPNSIVIFPGDHGPIFERDKKKIGSSKKPNIKLINNRISNFNAMLIPSRCEEKFYDTIGNVESIRLVLNCIGVDKIEPRKKSKSFIFYPNENPKIYNLEDLF